MPLDDGCRFDQHHGVEDLRPAVRTYGQFPVRRYRLKRDGTTSGPSNGGTG